MRNTLILTATFLSGVSVAAFVDWLVSLPVERIEASGIVRGVEYHAPYVTYESVQYGKTRTVRPVHHPASWTAQVSVTGVLVNTDFASEVRDGDVVVVRYRVDEVVKSE